MTDKSLLLIVDDQPDNLFVLTQVVESLLPGCEVMTALSAGKGLALAAEKRPDVALIDVQMPGMDGIEMCRKLKEDAQLQCTPVILITSHGATAEIKARSLEAGADDFISRPIDNEELAARIKVALRIKKAEDDLRFLNSDLASCAAVQTSELKRANQQMRRERNRLRDLIEIAPAIILELDHDGNIVTFNPYFEELSGYSLAEVRGRSWFEVFLPERDLTRVLSVFEKAIAGCETGGTVNAIRTKAGNERDIIWFNRTIEGTDDDPVRLLSIGQDVTDIRRSAEVQDVLISILRAATEESDLGDLISRIRQAIGGVLDTSNFYVALHDPENETYRFPYVVDRYESTEPDELCAMRKSLTDYVRRTGKATLVNEEIRADLEARGEIELIGEPSKLWLGAPLETNDGVIGVVAVQCYDNSCLYTVDDLALLTHVAGTISIAICRNQAQEQTTRLGRAVEDSVNEVYLYDTEDLHFTQVNRGARENLGYSMVELKKMTPIDLKPEFTKAAFSEMIEPLKSGASEKIQFSTVHQRKDGSLYPVEVNVSLVVGTYRPMFIAVILDITERQQTEAELQQYREHLEHLVELRTTELTRAKSVTEAVNEILLEALTCKDEDAVSQLCLGVARRLTSASFGFIAEINDRGRLDTFALDQPAWHACRIPETEASMLLLDMEVHGLWATVITSGLSQIINAPESHAASVGVPEDHPKIESFLGVPLIQGAQTFGLIAVANRQGGFSKADEEALTALSAAFVEVLMRLRAEQKAAKEGQERQKALNLMVGRELRMADLKKEIRALKEENQRLNGS